MVLVFEGLLKQDTQLTILFFFGFYRIIGHDETPQFVNHGKTAFTRNQVIGERGKSSETLTSINRESHTVHPFHDFDGNHLLCQVIFSGAGK